MSITLKQKIKIELIKSGVNGAQIGRKVGVSRDAISKTIKGEIKAYRLRKAIAETIGVTVEDLWPSNGNGHKPTGRG